MGGGRTGREGKAVSDGRPREGIVKEGRRGEKRGKGEVRGEVRKKCLVAMEK